jgi:hypothetical protein
MDATKINTVEAQADLHLLRELTSDDLFQTLVDWFLGTHAQRRSVAAAVMTRAGQVTTRLLIGEAFSSGQRQQRRVQLLLVIEQLGLPLEVGQWFDLQIKASFFGPLVRIQIARLLTHDLSLPGATLKSGMR